MFIVYTTGNVPCRSERVAARLQLVVVVVVVVARLNFSSRYWPNGSYYYNNYWYYNIMYADDYKHSFTLLTCANCREIRIRIIVVGVVSNS